MITKHVAAYYVLLSSDGGRGRGLRGKVVKKKRKEGGQGNGDESGVKGKRVGRRGKVERRFR